MPLLVRDNAAMSLDDCQGEIFRLYIAEKKTLKKVRARIEEVYGVSATEAVYKAKLEKWKYSKNTKRYEAIAILREKAHRESVGKESTFFLNNRPVDFEKVEQYRQRDRIQDIDSRSLFQPPDDRRMNIISKTPPRSPLQRPLPLPYIWRIPEKLMYEIDIYVKGSFESKSWHFNGNELIIQSSPSQESERRSLHAFIGGLDTGSTNFAMGKPEIGGLYWRKAFREIEALVHGQYHDIVPSMIQKINDLENDGHREAAVMLKRSIAQFSITNHSSGHVKTSIFKTLADVEIQHMNEMEEMIMTCYAELFDFYLGPRCYNSFVMRMNLARRKLTRGGSLDQCLPALSALDDTFGKSNPRPLDVLRLRIETLHQRKQHLETESQDLILIRRAESIEDDEWQRAYFLIKGWYFAGVAQHALENNAAAVFGLSTCLWWIEEFDKLDDTGIFNPEKVEILERLEELARVLGDEIGAVEWSAQRTQMLERLAALDDVLQAAVVTGTVDGE